MAVYSSVGDSPDVLDRWETISLLLIEARILMYRSENV